MKLQKSLCQLNSPLLCHVIKIKEYHAIFRLVEAPGSAPAKFLLIIIIKKNGSVLLTS